MSSSTRVLVVLVLTVLASIFSYFVLAQGKGAQSKAKIAAPAAKPEVKTETKSEDNVVASASAPAPATVPAVSAAPATTETRAAAPAVKVETAAVAMFVGKKFMQGPASIKKIAITFDDGPYPNTTPEVLSILKREGIRATFFMLGQSVEKYPEMAKTVADSGNEIGCHTMNHTNLRGAGADTIAQEVIGATDYIEKVTGKRPVVFRPPYGEYNAGVLKACAETGMVLVTWSVDTNDWRKGSTSASVHAACMKQTRGGGVILMHDTHAKSVAALPQIIADLKAKGYEFVTLSELLAESAKHPVLVAGAAPEAAPVPVQPVSIPLSMSGM